MASEIRVNSLTNRSGLSTVSITDTGAVIAGIVTATDAIFTGDITATNGTFSGNVSIGGTLTYEDVTNIDAVGVVTARNGLKILAGGANIVGTTTITHAEVTTAQFTGSYVNVDGNLDIADSIRHLGDTNTKIRFPAADTVTVETAGSERLRIDGFGGVGIKNTSPNNTLTVGDTVQPSYAPSSAGNYIEIARTSGADAGLLINKNTGQWLVGIDNSDGANAPLRFEYGAAGSAHPGFGAGTLGMIIKHDGKIGVGVANPGQKLVVKGTTSLMATNSTNQWMAYTYTDNTFRLNYNGAGADEITVLSSGEVAIGAFTPTAGDGILQISGGLRVAGSASASDTTSPYIYRTSGYDHLNIATSGTERLRIASNGTTTVGPQYDRVTIEPGNGTYDGEATTLSVDGRTNDGNRVALKVDRYDSGTSATTKFSVKYDGTIFTTSGMQAASVNLQSSSTASWFQTGANYGGADYVWAAKNTQTNTWHSGLKTTGDLYLGGNITGTRNISLNGSNGSATFTGAVAIGGNAAANTIDEYEEGTWTPVMNKSGVTGTAGTPTTGVGYYRKVGGLMYISFYWYKSTGSFGNNAHPWYVSGLPFNLTANSASGYQFIPGGYNNINGTNYQNQSNRWQSNSINGPATLTMYGPNSATNWTSGYLEFSASGVLMLA